MMSKRKRSERTSVRNCAITGVFMLLVPGLPGCVVGASPNARLTMQNAPSAVRQQVAVALVPDPVVFTDETWKSLPTEQYEESLEAYSPALYIDDPVDPGYIPVSDALWQICDDQLKLCTLPCTRKKDAKARSNCYQACNAKYFTCLQLAGLAKTFDALDKAWSWIKDNKGKVVGTIVIVGGIAYIVSTSGAGALILIPLAG